MKAPSEKHLEDWILANPIELGWMEVPDYVLPDGVMLDYEPLGRQVKVPSGVIDILAFSWDSIYIIELKKGEIGVSAFFQLLRYMRDVSNLWETMITAMPYPDFPDGNQYTQPKVCGILIGNNIPDKDFLIAADAAKVMVATYDFDGNSYHFEWAMLPSLKRRVKAQYYDMPVGQGIRKFYMQYLQSFYKDDEIQNMHVNGDIEIIKNMLKWSE